MRRIGIAELIESVVPEKTQLDVKREHGEHYFIIIKGIGSEGDELIIDPYKRADYDDERDLWFPSREALKPISVWMRGVQPVVDGNGKIVIRLGDEELTFTFHPVEKPFM